MFRAAPSLGGVSSIPAGISTSLPMASPAEGTPHPLSVAPSFTPTTASLPIPAGPAHQAQTTTTAMGYACPSLVAASDTPVFAASGALVPDLSSACGSLTTNSGPLPDPAAIEEQKQAYSRSLDLQFENGNNSLKLQNEQRKKQLIEAGEQRKSALILQVDQQVAMQSKVLDEQMNQAVLALKQAALDQRAILSQQAANLILECQQRKMQEEFVASQAEMKRQYLDSQSKLQSEAKRHYADVMTRVQATGAQQPGLAQSDATGLASPPMPCSVSLPRASYAAPPATYGMPIQGGIPMH